jgi:hypothetical protein
MEFGQLGRKSHCVFSGRRARAFGMTKITRSLSRTVAREAGAAFDRSKESYPLFIGAPTEFPRLKIRFMKEESFIVAAALGGLAKRECRPVAHVKQMNF